MKKYLVRYTHVEETTYEQWVEAESEDEAEDIIYDEMDFENVVGVQGVDIINIHVIEEGE